MRQAITLDEFRASARFHANMAHVILDADLVAWGQAGNVYVHDLFIEREANGRWFLTIANTIQTGELISLETTLYDWACSEGILG